MLQLLHIHVLSSCKFSEFTLTPMKIAMSKQPGIPRRRICICLINDEGFQWEVARR